MPRRLQPKRAITLALIAAIVVVLGLILRRLRPGADPATITGFIYAYAPDTLWGILIALLIAIIRPRWRTPRVVLTALAITIAIELSQLSKAAPLENLRQFAPARFLLGTDFAWSDIACLLAASAISAAILLLVGRPSPPSPPRGEGGRAAPG